MSRRILTYLVLFLTLFFTSKVTFAQQNLAIPQNLVAVGNTVAWDAVPNASGYRLKWLDEDGVYQEVDTPRTQFAFTQLTAGSPYVLYVQARGDGVQFASASLWSAAFIFTPKTLARRWQRALKCRR